MHKKTHLKIAASGIIAIGLLLGLLGCRHGVFTYNGRIVKPENRIPIMEGGPHTAVWKAEDLTVNYRYQRQDGTLEISGTVAFADHLVYNFRDFSNFILTLYFTDADGKILGDHTLTGAGMGQPIEEIPFHRRPALPPGAAGMVFGYQGRAVDMSGGDAFGVEGATDWEFWKTPTR